MAQTESNAAPSSNKGKWPPSLRLGIQFFLFVISFLIPIVVGVEFVRRSVQETDGIDDEDRELFDNSFRIPAPNAYIKVAHSEDLSPQDGQDFFLLLWFKIENLPSPGERVLILAKHEPMSRSQRGFALALAGFADGIRPELYWRDSEGKGRWFAFSNFYILPKRWAALAVSFRENRLLGLHGMLAAADGKPQSQLLGGYELDPTIMPTSDADLMIGAFNNGKFLGRIGAVGIFSAKKLSKRFDDLLRAIKREPKKIPDVFTAEEVRLWIDSDKGDSAPVPHKVEFIGGSRRAGGRQKN